MKKGSFVLWLLIPLLVIVLNVATFLLAEKASVNSAEAKEKFALLINEEFNTFNSSVWMSLPDTSPVEIEGGRAKVKIAGKTSSKEAMAGIRYKPKMEYPFVTKLKFKPGYGGFGIGIIDEYGRAYVISMVNENGDWYNIYRNKTDGTWKYVRDIVGLNLDRYYVIKLKFSSTEHFDAILYSDDESKEIWKFESDFQSGGNYIYIGSYGTDTEGEVDWMKIYGEKVETGYKEKEMDETYYAVKEDKESYTILLTGSILDPDFSVRQRYILEQGAEVKSLSEGLDDGLVGDEGCYIMSSHLDMYFPSKAIRFKLKFEKSEKPVILQIGYHVSGYGPPKVGIFWDDLLLKTLNFRSGAQNLLMEEITIPSDEVISKGGVHEIKIVDTDQTALWRNWGIVDAIKIIADAKISLLKSEEKIIDKVKVIPEVTKIGLDLAYFDPDYERYLEYFARECKTDLQKPAGALHIYLKNLDIKPITISKISIEGKNIDELLKENIIWYRVNPETIAPGNISETIIRFREKPEKNIMNIQFFAETGSSIQMKIEMKLPIIKIGYVAFNQNIDQMYVYIEKRSNEQLGLSKVYLNGTDITSNAEIYAPQFFKDVSLVKIKLPEPLKYGSFHTVKIISTTGEAAASLFRAWDSFFSIGTYGEYEDIDILQCNTHVRHYDIEEEALSRLSTKNMRTVLGILEPEKIKRLKRHPAMFAYYLTDEPDGADYLVGKPIGFFAMTLEREMVKPLRELSEHLTLVNIDNTYPPLGYYIYGKIADILSCALYPVTYEHELRWVQRVVETVRFSCAPRPFIPICEAMAHEGTRFSAPEEVRIIAYYMIGSGAKGINYWTYWPYKTPTGGVYGFLGNTPVTTEVNRINSEIKTIAHLLSKGHPIDLVTSSNERIWASALLCGEKDIVVVLVNENYSSTKGSFNYTPIEDVRIEVKIPDWMDVKEASLISYEGIKKLTYKKLNGKIKIEIGKVDVTNLVVLGSFAGGSE